MRHDKASKEQAITVVLDSLATGESLRKSATKANVPASTFLLWVEEDEKLAERYAQARARGVEVEFDRLQEIVEEVPPKNENGMTDSGWIAWKRLQVDTFKWQLSKKRPERYGDKIDLKHSGSVGLSININLDDK
jgi:hypothetical protein